MDKKLFLELKKRFEIDQKLCNGNLNKKFKENCNKNSRWIKRLVSQEEWSFVDKVGKQGELYAWLIVQHSEDIDFQKYCLSLMEKFPKTKERSQNIAYLTDRILIRENKKQIYGTQFSNGKIMPTINKGNLNNRRRKIGLESLEEYKKYFR